MENPEADNQAVRPSSRVMAWYSIAFFLCLLVIFYSSSFMGMHDYTDDVEKIAYQQTQAHDPMQNDITLLPWTGVLDVDPHGSEVDIVFVLKDAHNKPVDGALVQASFLLPPQSNSEVKTMLQPDGKGRYTGKATLLWHGQWTMKVMANVGGQSYQQSKTLEMK